MVNKIDITADLVRSAGIVRVYDVESERRAPDILEMFPNRMSFPATHSHFANCDGVRTSVSFSEKYGEPVAYYEQVYRSSVWANHVNVTIACVIRNGRVVELYREEPYFD